MLRTVERFPVRHRQQLRRQDLESHRRGQGARHINRSRDRSERSVDGADRGRCAGVATELQTLSNRLVIGLAALALLLAVVNVYALSASPSCSAERDIGIRVALGASAADAMRLVMRRGLAWTAAGLVRRRYRRLLRRRTTRAAPARSNDRARSLSGGRFGLVAGDLEPRFVAAGAPCGEHRSRNHAEDGMTRPKMNDELFRPLELSQLRVPLLFALGTEAKHGYAIRRDIAAESSGRIRLLPGTLYSTIKKLLTDGLLEEVDEPRTPARTMRGGGISGDEEGPRGGGGRNAAHGPARQTGPRVSLLT